MKSIAIVLHAALIAASCGSATTPTSEKYTGPGGRHVLFIGNSLTYANVLPDIVRDIAQVNGDTIVTSMVAQANYALIDHINDGVGSTIKSAHWDIVVLQQGPTSVGVNGDSLVLWTRMFDPMIREAGGRPALYMVWPDASRLSAMTGVHASYYAAAAAVNGLFFPAGDAWTMAWKTDPSLKLYSSDNFHPSLLGSGLAALVIVEQITGRDARTYDAARIATLLSTDAAKVRVLLDAAHAANAAYARP